MSLSILSPTTLGQGATVMSGIVPFSLDLVLRSQLTSPAGLLNPVQTTLLVSSNGVTWYPAAIATHKLFSSSYEAFRACDHATDPIPDLISYSTTGAISRNVGKQSVVEASWLYAMLMCQGPPDGGSCTVSAWADSGLLSGDAIVALTDGPTINIDLALGNTFAATLGGNRTLNPINAHGGKRFVLYLTQDSTGSRTVTWWSTIKWPGGTAPTLTTTPGKQDVFLFTETAAGAWDGFTAGQNL
jgi:hypothetical protein